MALLVMAALPVKAVAEICDRSPKRHVQKFSMQGLRNSLGFGGARY
jgi:hypothetical protein